MVVVAITCGFNCRKNRKKPWNNHCIGLAKKFTLVFPWTITSNPNELFGQCTIWTWVHVNLSFWLSHLLAMSPCLLWADVSWKMEALADLRRKFYRLKELILVVLGKEWVPSKWQLPSCVIWLRLWSCCIANTPPLNLSGWLRYHWRSYSCVCGSLMAALLKAVNQTEVCSYVSHFAVSSFLGYALLMADDRNTRRTWQKFAMPFNISAQNSLMITCAHFPLARASHMANFKVNGLEKYNLPSETMAQYRE